MAHGNAFLARQLNIPVPTCGLEVANIFGSKETSRHSKKQSNVSGICMYFLTSLYFSFLRRFFLNTIRYRCNIISFITFYSTYIFPKRSLFKDKCFLTFDHCFSTLVVQHLVPKINLNRDISVAERISLISF